MSGIERFDEAWPAGTGFELAAGAEQRQAAQAARVHAGLLVVQQAAAERRFGAVVEQHATLLRRQARGEAFAHGGVGRREVMAGCGTVRLGGCGHRGSPSCFSRSPNFARSLPSLGAATAAMYG